jgi:2-amino-4-hydroxy-6-hydroxymethyldihydropteridine diphosphokinase
MPAIAYVALGSNLGDRRSFLEQTVADLRHHPGISVTAVSSFHETDAVGGPPNQNKYLNAAIELKTDLDPHQLLHVLQDIETRLGRVRTEPSGPRTIDLDLLLYGDQVLESTDLQIPHPRMHERTFVLGPLAEIAGDLMHPRSKRPIRDLLREQQHQSGAAAARPLKGLRAMITGSSSGIGRAIALALAGAGADVIIHRRGPVGKAEAVATEARTLGVRAAALRADLQTLAECNRLAEQAWNLWQGLDIWVNNAGVDTLTGPALSWSFERKLSELLAVDLCGTIALSRNVGERMKRIGNGVILNMGWDQAETGMAGDSGELFAAAKGAVMAFSKSLARSLAPEVRVNCLAPGWIRTAWGEKAGAQWQELVVRETPLARWGSPEDVAEAALWLVSPAARYVTGQVIRINGGSVT